MNLQTLLVHVAGSIAEGKPTGERLLYLGEPSSARTISDVNLEMPDRYALAPVKVVINGISVERGIMYHSELEGGPYVVASPTTANLHSSYIPIEDTDEAISRGLVFAEKDKGKAIMMANAMLAFSRKGSEHHEEDHESVEKPDTSALHKLREDVRVNCSLNHQKDYVLLDRAGKSVLCITNYPKVVEAVYDSARELPFVVGTLGDLPDHVRSHCTTTRTGRDCITLWDETNAYIVCESEFPDAIVVSMQAYSKHYLDGDQK